MDINPNYTALFVGSGAVQESWEPVLRALQLPTLSKKISKDGANTLLANIVYNCRFYHSTDDILMKQVADRAMANTKMLICQHLEYAQNSGELKVWSEFDNILDLIVLTDTKALEIISTNWDFVIDEAVRKHHKFANRKTQVNVLHLHGSTSNPWHIYLPTEIVDEIYRTDEEKHHLGGVHAQTMTHLQFAAKIVIYGLSISALDAELLQTIKSALDSPFLTEIIIVDPKHEQIAEKLILVKDTTSQVSIIGVDPSNLTLRITY